MALSLTFSSSTRFDNKQVQADQGVSTPSLSWQRMEQRRLLTRALRGGSDQMREESLSWMSPYEGEEVTDFVKRLRKSFLLPAYDDTIDKHTSKPFSREVIIPELPQPLLDILGNVDLEGNDLTQFLRGRFEAALDDGMSHVLVDFPDLPPGLSKAEEEELGARPYWIPYSSTQVLGATWRHRANGTKELESIRLHTVTVEPKGFGEDTVEFIRRYVAPPLLTDKENADLAEDDLGRRGVWELYRKERTDGEWPTSPNDSGTYSFPFIPFFTLYFDQVGDLESRPPLWNLAETNLEHWQKKSDFDNLSTVISVPILGRFGFSKAELDKGITVGAGHSTGSTNKDARIDYTVADPAGLGALRQNLIDIQENMEMLGLEPLLRRASSQLATSLAIGDATEVSMLQAWVMLTEIFGGDVTKATAVYMSGVEVPDDWKPDIFDEFGLSSQATDNIKAIQALRMNGDLSRKEILEEYKRYDVLVDSLDVDLELARIEEEGRKDLGAEEEETEGVPQVTATGGDPPHTHEVAVDAAFTGPPSTGHNDHVHSIAEDGSIGSADAHTH